jgi:quercetin dioxygenase-like cupin family protein
MLGQMTGQALYRRERHEISPGDLIHIPAKITHQALIPEGGEAT